MRAHSGRNLKINWERISWSLDSKKNLWPLFCRDFSDFFYSAPEEIFFFRFVWKSTFQVSRRNLIFETRQIFIVSPVFSFFFFNILCVIKFRKIVKKLNVELEMFRTSWPEPMISLQLISCEQRASSLGFHGTTLEARLSVKLFGTNDLYAERDKVS